MSKEFRWIQLSDIHFNFMNYGTQKLRDALILEFKKLAIQKKIDVILITGDIAFKGQEYQDDLFEFLDNILIAAGLNRSNLCIVPGNHDLKREDHRETLINGILKSNDPIEKANIIGIKTFNDLIGGQKDFLNFYKKLTGEAYPKKELHFIKSFDLYNIIHINSCLLSGVDKEEGAMIIGQQKLYNVMKKLIDNGENKVNIAIAHHTLDCLDERERVLFENNLNDCNIDILLCGHMHKPKYTFCSDNQRVIPMLTCGAGMTDSYTDPCFLTGDVNLTDSTCNVNYYSWKKDMQFWYCDNTIGRRTVNGSLNFNLERFNCREEEEAYRDVADEDKFKQFIIDFHSFITEGKEAKLPFVKKDVQKKFENMKCNGAAVKQYDSISTAFPIINEIMDSSTFCEYWKKITIIGVIIEEYNRFLDKCATGTEIIEKMVESIFEKYKDRFKYPESTCKIYIKTLIYWCIYECDIFNDKKD